MLLKADDMLVPEFVEALKENGQQHLVNILGFKVRIRLFCFGYFISFITSRHEITASPVMQKTY